uniref:hypothetical protein n=1 Tax=Halarcobacter sp. TaxID=2321133 RepID=UPI003A8DFAFA
MLGKKIKLSLISASLLCSTLHSADLIINSEVNIPQNFNELSDSALITEDGFINYNSGGNTIGIRNDQPVLSSLNTFVNEGKIHIVSTGGIATGVDIGHNDSTVSNDGEIDVSGYNYASGIRTSNSSSANINNSGLIKVNSSASWARAIDASSNYGTINNSGTIIASKNMQ